MWGTEISGKVRGLASWHLELRHRSPLFPLEFVVFFLNKILDQDSRRALHPTYDCHPSALHRVLAPEAGRATFALNSHCTHPPPPSSSLITLSSPFPHRNKIASEQT